MTTPARKSFDDWLPLLVIGPLALFWRLWGITRTEVWRDEAITLLHTDASWRQLITRLPFVEDTPPLSFLVFKAWSLASGDVLWMRMLPVLLGVATVCVLMRWAAMWQRSAAWPVGLLAAFAHVPLHYSQELRGYSFQLLLVAMGLYAAERSVRRCGGWRSWLWPALLAAAAGYVHVSGLFVYPMLVSYVLLRQPSDWKRRLLSAVHLLWLAAIAPAVWFSWYWTRLHLAEGDWWLRPLETHHLGEVLSVFFGLEPAIQRELSASGLRTLWWMFAMERVVALVTAALAVLAWLNPRTRIAGLALALAAVVFAACLIVSSFLSLPNVLIRTMLPVWAPTVLLLGLGGVGWGARWQRYLGPVLAVCLAAFYAGGWIWLVEAGKPRRVESAALCHWMRDHLSPQDLVVSMPPWFEDQIAYSLGDVLAGERMFTAYTPVYKGLPARHTLLHRHKDPHWQSRLRDLITERQAAADSQWSLFLVIYGTHWKYQELDDLRAILAESLQEVACFPDQGVAMIQVTRLKPVKMAESEQMPASYPAFQP